MPFLLICAIIKMQNILPEFCNCRFSLFQRPAGAGRFFVKQKAPAARVTCASGDESPRQSAPRQASAGANKLRLWGEVPRSGGSGGGRIGTAGARVKRWREDE